MHSGNGGISADSSNGGTVVKLRGALSDHSYINNEFVSVGRGGQSQDYGGTVDGAQFTVSSTTREPDYGLWDANNYQMMLQSAKDSLGRLCRAWHSLPKAQHKTGMSVLSLITERQATMGVENFISAQRQALHHWQTVCML
jgi:hypothetical protein